MTENVRKKKNGVVFYPLAVLNHGSLDVCLPYGKASTIGNILIVTGHARISLKTLSYKYLKIYLCYLKVLPDLGVMHSSLNCNDTNTFASK